MDSKDDYITAWSEDGDKPDAPAENAVAAAAKKIPGVPEADAKAEEKPEADSKLSEVQQFLKAWKELQSVNADAAENWSKQ